MLSANPKLSRDEIRDILQRTADKIGPAASYQNGRSVEFGFGRANATKAVAEALRIASATKPTRAISRKRSAPSGKRTASAASTQADELKRAENAARSKGAARKRTPPLQDDGSAKNVPSSGRTGSKHGTGDRGKRR
jgi:hypothetical protein